jgi:hypothetical protein
MTLTARGLTLACSIEKYHGHVVGTSVESVTATPTFTECVAFGFVGAKITGLGHYPEAEGAGPYCDFSFGANGSLALVCPEGKDVTINGGTCIMHIPAQTGLGTISYTTSTWESKHALTLDINVTGITASYTDGFACPFNGSGENAEATVVGKATVWGEDATTGSAVGITWDATTA